MPLFTIRREVGGANIEEIQAGALRGMMCAYEYPGMRWVRSYWVKDRGEVVCLFEADAMTDLQEHASRARLPCDEIHEIIEIDPASYVQPDALRPGQP